VRSEVCQRRPLPPPPPSGCRLQPTWARGEEWLRLRCVRVRWGPGARLPLLLELVVGKSVGGAGARGGKERTGSIRHGDFLLSHHRRFLLAQQGGWGRHCVLCGIYNSRRRLSQLFFPRRAQFALELLAAAGGGVAALAPGRAVMEKTGTGSGSGSGKCEL
jgi:hypothetical protein